MSAFAFPTARAAPVIIVGAALRLRPARGDDLAFLRRLYRTFRAEEMAPIPWTQAAKAAFLDDQFRLQHHHFTTVYAESDFLVVEQAGAPIGRLYLQRRSDAFLLVDIGFLPEARGQGLGRALIAWVGDQARAAGAPKVELHVLPHNVAALKLYTGLGFETVGLDHGHLRMEWRLS